MMWPGVGRSGSPMPKADDVHAGVCDFRLHPVDFREEIGRQALEPVRAFDVY